MTTRASARSTAFVAALLVGLTAGTVQLPAQSQTAWYERLRLRGYGQLRYNRLLENNPQYKCEGCDKSWGEPGGLYLKRARLALQGQVHPRVYIYFQSDFASGAGTTGNVAQLKDWYADVGLDPSNALRLRLGLSKVPFSYENIQSSQNRLPMDRADVSSSANPGERDVGVFALWAPPSVRARYAKLTNSKLKGSGDYGALALGVFNGQGANRAEANGELHVLARASYPFEIHRQVIEPGIAAFSGSYVVTADQRSSGVKGRSDWTYKDERVIASLSLAPQPFGVLAEYTIGRGPEYLSSIDSISTRHLEGGFLTVSYRLTRNGQTVIPFARYQAYDGGKKNERDARSYMVRDRELGLEWQVNDALEITAEWYQGRRRFEDNQLPRNVQSGHLLRLQVQVNY